MRRSCIWKGPRHPVVEQFSATPFVPNDLELHARRRMLVITVPTWAASRPT